MKNMIRLKLYGPEGPSNPDDPYNQLVQAQLVGMIEKSIETLPRVNEKTFLLRFWEEMDVTETAKIMGCSEGSVKTHCSRATHALAMALKKKGVSYD